MSKSKFRHRISKWMVVVLAVVAVLSASMLSEKPAQAHGKECYKASYYENVKRDGTWHWRAVANVKQPVPSIGKWHVHGPNNAQPWPNSTSESYGKFYIYFSLPSWTSPKWPASEYQACVN